MDKNLAHKAAQEFQVDGELEKLEENTTGHINSTFFCYWNQHSNDQLITVLQRINNQVFPRPEVLDTNIQAVISHLNSLSLEDKGGMEVYNLIPAKNGKTLLVDESGYWRMCSFIQGCECVDTPRSVEEVRNVGAFFGSFHRCCDSFKVDSLGIPIENFQDVAGRFDLFKTAVEEDRVSRCAAAVADIEQAKKFKEFVIEHVTQYSSCPLRVTHGDPKYNNFLIKKGTDIPVSLIDLDTLMPGYAYYDVGDFIRGISMKGDEDAANESERGVKLDVTLAAFEGYLSEAKSCLSKSELESLVDSAKLLSVSLGVRFLTDYLMGDAYFRTSRDEQNLDRARTQLALAEDFSKYREKFLEML